MEPASTRNVPRTRISRSRSILGRYHGCSFQRILDRLGRAAVTTTLTDFVQMIPT
jgi:hypothetical protein